MSACPKRLASPGSECLSAVSASPDSAIACIEYANALVMLFGNSKMDQAIKLYEKAAAATPVDAMERLDVELAKAELED